MRIGRQRRMAATGRIETLLLRGPGEPQDLLSPVTQSFRFSKPMSRNKRRSTPAELARPGVIHLSVRFFRILKPPLESNLSAMALSRPVRSSRVHLRTCMPTRARGQMPDAAVAVRRVARVSQWTFFRVPLETGTGYGAYSHVPERRSRRLHFWRNWKPSADGPAVTKRMR
jgi:hypothetical protein